MRHLSLNPLIKSRLMIAKFLTQTAVRKCSKEKNHKIYRKTYAIDSIFIKVNSRELATLLY